MQHYVKIHRVIFAQFTKFLEKKVAKSYAHGLSRVVARYGFLLFSANIHDSSQTGLKTQECKRNLYAIYTGRNQNSINTIAWVSAGPLLYRQWFCLCFKKKFLWSLYWNSESFDPVVYLRWKNLIVSMTSLLMHTVAHSTRPSFRPKPNNQTLKKFLILVISWVKVVKNCKILTFKVKNYLNLPKKFFHWKISF